MNHASEIIYYLKKRGVSSKNYIAEVFAKLIDQGLKNNFQSFQIQFM